MDLHQALGIFPAKQSPQRWELEARLLTSQPIIEVAACCRISPRTVEAYAAAFFDVRPRLAARDWVARIVIGPGMWHGFSDDETGQIWKVTAFTGGTEALELLLTLTLDRPLPEWLRALSPADQARLRFSVKLMVAANRARSLAQLKNLIDVYEQAAGLDRSVHGDQRVLTSDLRIARQVLELATAPLQPVRRRQAQAPGNTDTVPTMKAEAQSNQTTPAVR